MHVSARTPGRACVRVQMCAHVNACGLRAACVCVCTRECVWVVCVRAACVCFRVSREQLRPSLHERTAPRTPVEAGPAPAARDPPVEAGRSTLHLRLGALR